MGLRDFQEECFRSLGLRFEGPGLHGFTDSCFGLLPTAREGKPRRERIFRDQGRIVSSHSISKSRPYKLRVSSWV